MAKKSDLEDAESLFPGRPVVFAVCAALFLASAWRFLDHTVDDAFIAYRYADHWAAGLGPVFNAGEHVEGYTSFLWVALLAGGRLLGIAPATLAPILGILASLAILGLLAASGPDPKRHPITAWLAPLLFATSPVFAIWATGGLEIPLFALFVLAAGLSAARGLADGRLPLSAAVLCGLGALTRPEGLGLAAIVGVWALFALPPGRTRVRDGARFALVLVLLLLPHEIWRLSYYGYPLPNTYYAKVGGGLAQVTRGLEYVSRFLVRSRLAPLAVCLALPFAGSRRSRGLVALLGLAFLGIAVAVGGETMPMYRFLAPALPPLWFASAWGWARIGTRLESTRAAAPTGALLLLAATVLSALPASTGPDRAYLDQGRSEVASWRAIGAWFARKAAPEATIGVVTAGAIPYLSGLRTIDLLGLNDATIAHHPVEHMGRGPAGHERHFESYVLDRSPEYLVLGVYGLAKKRAATRDLVTPYFAAEVGLLDSPRFQREYVLRRARTPEGDFPYFARRDIAVERRAPAQPATAAAEEDVWASGMQGLWAKAKPATGNAEEEAAALEKLGYAQGFEAAGSESGVVVFDRERAGGGWNLSASGHAPEAALFDMQGKVAHRWHLAYGNVPGALPDAAPESSHAWRRVALRHDGSLLAIYEGLGLVAVDIDSHLLWYHAGREHHDLEVLPDGRIRTLTRRARIAPEIDPEHPILEDFLTTLSADGQELSNVSLLRCFQDSAFEDLLDRRAYQSGDIFHTNTVETLDGRLADRVPAFASGNVLLSMRHLNAIVVVDPEAKRVVWAATGPWRKQHQPTVLDDGNLLLFDNAGYRGSSQVIEVDPATLQIRWAWRGTPPESFFSIYCGSNQRLANGNTLVSDTCSGRAFEVTSAGDIVWDYRSPHRAGPNNELVAALFEVIRIPEDSALLTWMR